MTNTILVGPMGAGKSTIGRLLAKELHVPFKDSDKEIEQRTTRPRPAASSPEGGTDVRTGGGAARGAGNGGAEGAVA